MRRAIKTGVFILIGLSAGFIALANGDNSAQAACPALNNTIGSATITVNVPATTTYVVWSRMKAGSADNNSYYLQIDDAVCGINVGDTSEVTTGGFTWINHKDASATNKITVSLTAGSHQIKLIGREAGVQVDKIILLSDLTCNPNQVDCQAIANDVAPSAPTNLQITAGNQTAIMSWGANTEPDLNQYLVSYKKSSQTAWPSSVIIPKTNTTYSFSGLTNGESYDFRVAASDVGGNASSFTQKSATPIAPADTQPPTVSLTKPINNATVSGNVQFEAAAQDNVTIKKVEFYVNDIWVGTDITSPYTYLWLSTAAAEDQNHSVTAKAYDNTNPPTVSSPVSIKVDNVDNISPTVQISSPDDGSVAQSSSVSITATAQDNTSISTTRVLVDGIERFSTAGAAVNYSWPLTDADSGAHIIRVEAVDPSGNVGADIVGISVQLDDQTPPTAPEGLQASVGDGSINLSWSAATEPDFNHYAVRYKRVSDADVGSSWTWPATSLTSNSYSFTGLTNGVEYDVQVRAVDSSTNKSDYSGIRATPNSQDAEPPQPPTNLTVVSSGSGQLNLGWQASPSGDTIGYNVYRNGIKTSSSVTSTTFGESGLVNNTLYSYQVSAVDAAGNESALTAAAIGTPIGSTTAGNLAGVVKDNTGKLLSAYIYTYVGKSKKATTSNSGTGLYLLSSLPAGPYNLYAQKPGYSKLSIKTATLAGQLTTQNISLSAR